MEQLNNQVSMLKKTVEVMQSDAISDKKASAAEFQRIGQAFQRFGELIDLLYLEVSVLIELFDKKKIINQDEFKAQLEETGKKMEEEAKKNYEEMMKKQEAEKNKDNSTTNKEEVTNDNKQEESNK